MTDEPTRNDRWRLIAEWAGAIAAIVAAVSGIIFGLVQLGGNDGEAPPAGNGEPPKGAEEGPMNSEEQRLISLIPSEEVAASCAPLRDGADAPGEIAEIECLIPGGGTVWYQAYQDGLQAKANWDETRKGYEEDDGNPWGCDAAANAFYYEGTYRSEDGIGDGWLRCYMITGEAWMDWTDTSQRVYATATRPDGAWKPLVELWTSLGPRG